MLTTAQDLFLEIRLHSEIATRSPGLHSFAASCASTLLVRRMYLPYTGCLMRRSIATETVLSILSLTTRPTTVRCTFFVSSLIFLHLPSALARSEWFSRARCPCGRDYARGCGSARPWP